MTTRLPSICCGSSGVSRTFVFPPKNHRRHVAVALRARVAFHTTTIRQEAAPKPFNKAGNEEDTSPPEQAALLEISGRNGKHIHPVNPPRSTRPPDLVLPDRAQHHNAFTYYLRLGRSYGSFYWRGLKCVWYNWQASKSLQKGKQWEDLRRSEFQLLERNGHDIGKLPFFGLLVALFGEWLPLLVPFIPSAVPGTCRIPKQVLGMRGKAEERRRESFRRGIAEPAMGELVAGKDGEAWSMTKREMAREVLGGLKAEQLFHLSCTLNNHNRLWDRVQLPPPTALLRSGLSKKLSYIAKDDKLLVRDGGVPLLSPEELDIACEERGIDVLGKQEETLRANLDWWLARQQEDQGRGRAVMVMLFRRPNAWATEVSPSSSSSSSRQP
ncbi:hypothetical protein DOTSEDRAFT_74909 [Lecanosticta acicola]|uniref:Letm1 RBD domain-containing protein n=1 Tax=Lecanosticta acicola TaxID=111012 RepID=A0AAI8Z156_9PEZI|nr:hypothetical protein DOTSEDRAFT_74909 [Lecanosticta acicola]